MKAILQTTEQLRAVFLRRCPEPYVQEQWPAGRRSRAQAGAPSVIRLSSSRGVSCLGVIAFITALRSPASAMFYMLTLAVEDNRAIQAGARRRQRFPHGKTRSRAPVHSAYEPGLRRVWRLGFCRGSGSPGSCILRRRRNQSDARAGPRARRSHDHRRAPHQGVTMAWP